MTIIWIMLCVLVGYCADKKGRNGWAWGISAVFLTPMIASIALVVMTDEKDEKAQKTFSAIDSKDEEKYCPECGYQAQPGENYCPRCGEMLW